MAEYVSSSRRRYTDASRVANCGMRNLGEYCSSTVSFNKMMNGSQVNVAFHVDDLLVTSVSDDNIDYVIKCLKENFTEITVNKGNKHSFFLGNKY
jgi:hypothetical protein